MARYTAPFDKRRRSVDLQFADDDDSTFAPKTARDFDFDAATSRNEGSDLVPPRRYGERDIKETIGIQRGRDGEHERELYEEHGIYDTRPEPERRINKDEIDVIPHHHHKKREGDRIRKREHTTECICLDCVRTRRYGEEYSGARQLTINSSGEKRVELCTEVTKDLVAEESLREFGYPYEEANSVFRISQSLHQDQIQDLIELTKKIRRERVRDIEYYDRVERVDTEDTRKPDVRGLASSNRV